MPIRPSTGRCTPRFEGCTAGFRSRCTPPFHFHLLPEIMRLQHVLFLLRPTGTQSRLSYSGHNYLCYTSRYKQGLQRSRYTSLQHASSLWAMALYGYRQNLQTITAQGQGKTEPIGDSPYCRSMVVDAPRIAYSMLQHTFIERLRVVPTDPLTFKRR